MALDWFLEWAHRHTQRVPRFDWPGWDSEFWTTHEALFERLRISEAAAEAAAKAIAENPPSHLDKFIPALKAILRSQAEASKARPIEPERCGDWDFKAEAHWAGLSEAERETWRQLTRERMPEWPSPPEWREKMAMGWAYSPSFIAGLPPARRPAPAPAVRQALDTPPRRHPVEKSVSYVPTGDLADGQETPEEHSGPDPRAGREARAPEPPRPGPRRKRGDKPPEPRARGRGPEPDAPDR